MKVIPLQATRLPMRWLLFANSRGSETGGIRKDTRNRSRRFDPLEPLEKRHVAVANPIKLPASFGRCPVPARFHVHCHTQVYAQALEYPAYPEAAIQRSHSLVSVAGRYPHPVWSAKIRGTPPPSRQRQDTPPARHSAHGRWPRDCGLRWRERGYLSITPDRLGSESSCQVCG